MIKTLNTSIMFILLINLFSLTVHATTPPAISVFNNAGVTFNTVSGGDFDQFKIIDSIEKLYMIRYDMDESYVITSDLDFTDRDSYITPDLIGDFNGDGVSETFITEMTTSSGWVPIGSNLDGTAATTHTFIGELIGSGLRIINGLRIDRAIVRQYDSIGFFRSVRLPTIQNLHFTDIDFNLVDTSVTIQSQSVGVIAGYAAGISVNKVFLEGSLNVSGSNLNRTNIGGLVGSAGDDSRTMTISETIIALEILVNPTSYYDASNTEVAGFIGYTTSTVIIEKSAFLGSIDSSTPIGGFISDLNAGVSRKLTIRNSYVNADLTNRGNLTSTAGMGGFVATIAAGSRSSLIQNSYSTGSLIQNHAGNKTYVAGVIGADNVSSEHSRDYDNVFSTMENDSTSSKLFGQGYLSNLRTNELINTYLVNNLATSGVVAAEAALVSSIQTIEEAFTSSFQTSVVGSGSIAWSIEDGRMPLLYYSGTTQLMPLQTYRILRNGVIQSASAIEIIYNTNSNSGVISVTEIQGNLLNPPTVVREGFQFDGWYTDAGLTNRFDISSAVNNNLTLFAKWILTTFTITLDSIGGSIVGPVSGNEGDIIGLPEPTLKDYRFDGWLNSQGQLVSNPYTVKNINETFSAKWTFVTFSPITIIPLERTYYLKIDEPMDIEFGEELILPEFDAYEMFGRIKTDLSEYVTITGEIGTNPGEYPITYTLSYEDTLITEEVMVKVVDNIPPTLTVDMPSSVFYKNEATPVITTSDNAPGEVTVTPVMKLDVLRPGVQLVIYDAVDASGNLTRVIQEVSVVIPDVRYLDVTVNSQRMIFVMYEHLMDFASMELYMSQSVLEPPISSNEWEVYEEREFIATGPGERVYLQMRDALGNIISRESIELFWREVEEFTPRRIRGEVVYPEIEPSYYIPWPLVGGISFGTISLSGLSFWFLKRRKKEKD